MTSFDNAVEVLHSALRTWNKGASPELLARAAMAFDQVSQEPTPNAIIGAAISRALAGNLAGDFAASCQRLTDALSLFPDHAGLYVALGFTGLRKSNPIDCAAETAWALVSARSLAPRVGCLERLCAAALALSGEFMLALHCARTAVALDPNDREARLWAGLLRLYFGGDATAATTLVEFDLGPEARSLCPAFGLSVVAGRWSLGEFAEARAAMRRVITPLNPLKLTERFILEQINAWFQTLKRYGPGVVMAPERYQQDTGGPNGEYARTRAALWRFHEEILQDPEGARRENIEALAVEALVGELEANTRRRLLRSGSLLVVCHFANAFLPLMTYLEAPSIEVMAAMDLVVCQG